MHWFIPALFVAFTYALQGIFAKQIFRQTKLHESGLLFLSVCLAIPLLAPFALATPMPPLNKTFLLALSADVILNLVAFTAYYGAIRRTDLSIAMPLVALTPVYMLLTSRLILGESASTAGWSGVLLAGFGCYLLGAAGAKHPLDPLKKIIADPGARLAFLTGIIWSITANLEKVAVLNSSPIWFPMSFQCLFSLLYFPVWFRLPKEQRIPQNRQAWNLVLLHCITGILLYVVQMNVLQWTLAQYVVAVKRSGIIVSVVAGIWWFKEEHGIFRLMATLIILTGVILILLAG
jgi:drug/metabolite transporter (DMT)-like permease